MNMVKMQLQWQEREKEKQRFDDMRERQMREMQEQRLKEEDELKKQNEQQRKQMYSQALQYQKNLQELNKHNFGKMTFQEKRLNKEDLHHWKSGEPDLTAMIPGINNTSPLASHLVRAKPREKEVPGKIKLSMSPLD